MIVRHLFVVLVALVVMFGPGPVAAQEAPASTAAAPVTVTAPVAAVARLADGSLDFATWERLANRIEVALEGGRASDSMFSKLREQLVAWRAEFSTIRDANHININTLQTQIATLGPAPAEGGSEPAILTQRRDQLSVLLAQAQQPVLNAEEAYGRANVLIGEIDALARARQGNALVSLGPSPIAPANWAEAWRAVSETMTLSWQSMAGSWGSETQTEELKRGLPVTLLLAILGSVLLLRGRAWVMQLRAGIYQRAMGPGQRVLGFLISLGQMVAPVLGIYSLLLALNRVGVLDLHAQALADALPGLGVTYFVALWLGSRVFGSATATHAVIELASPAKAAQGRYSLALLGLIYGLYVVMVQVADYEVYSQNSVVVLGFPLIAAAGLVLFRLGVLLREAGRDRSNSAEGGAAPVGLHARLMPLVGRVLMAVGIIGPLAAAVGYGTLAERLIYPSVLTLAVLALLEILHLFFADLFSFVTRKDKQEANEALIPVLASFVLVLLALPVLALIWGARTTDLIELWTALGEGFVLGDARVTPWTFVTLAIVFAIGYAITRVLQGTLKNSILPKTNMDKGGQNAVISGLGYVGIFVAAMVAITSAGVDLSSLAIVAGALSVGIGFGLQNVVSNFVSGIILLIERPISEGDWIEVGGQMGYVRDISVRSTRIETFDRTDVILPNSDLISGVVTNYTRGNSIGRVIVPVGVAYGTDSKRVESILRELAQAHPMVAVNPPPSVVFQGFGADALDFEIRAILRDVNFILSVKSDLNHAIAQRFNAEGIEIPFAQRDVWLRNPEVLAGASGARAGGKAADITPSDTDQTAASAGLVETDMPENAGTAETDD